MRPDTYRQEVVKLRERVEAMEAELAAFRSLALPRSLPHPCRRLTPTEQRVLALFLRLDVVSIDALMALAPDDLDAPLNWVRVYVSRLRQALRPLHFRIENVHSVGYRLERRSELRDLIEKKGTGNE